MAINPPTISPADRKTLAQSYQQLLDSRQQMIDGMKPVEDSAFRRGILIDSIIDGLMAHLHEMARNTSVHKEELQNFGGTLDMYARRFVNEATLIFSNLSGPAAQTPPSTRGGGSR